METAAQGKRGKERARTKRHSKTKGVNKSQWGLRKEKMPRKRRENAAEEKPGQTSRQQKKNGAFCRKGLNGKEKKRFNGGTLKNAKFRVRGKGV